MLYVAKLIMVLLTVTLMNVKHCFAMYPYVKRCFAMYPYVKHCFAMYPYAECHYANCHYGCSVSFQRGAIILSDTLPKGATLTAIMMSVVMLNVAAPYFDWSWRHRRRKVSKISAWC
jgi:hypothetical protein